MAMKREPCFWLDTADSTNGKKERERTIMVNGRRVTEKFPQHGHQGDYENKTRAPGTRFIYVVRHEGHVVPLLLTNAAAHLDPSGPYGNYQRAKARFLGWYPEGACPAALLAAGELDRNQLASEEVRTAKPCAEGTHSRKAPCKHDLAERAARTAQWNSDQAERLAGFRSDADRYAEQLAKANASLVKDVAHAVATEVAGAVRPPGEARAAEVATEPPPDPGKSGKPGK